MSAEQLLLKDFDKIPVVGSDVVSEEDIRNPRFPLIDQIVTIYGSESLHDEGLTWFDDGEDRFLLALDVKPKYERMLIAKMEDPSIEYRFTKGNALIVEARYTVSTDRLLDVNYYLLDFSKLNGANEESDWISLFLADELNPERLSDLLIETPENVEAVKEKVHGWWELSPFEALR